MDDRRIEGQGVEVDPSVELIESVFGHLSWVNQIRVLVRLHGKMDVCPRCLTQYRYKEERDAKICAACVISFLRQG